MHLEYVEISHLCRHSPRTVSAKRCFVSREGSWDTKCGLAIGVCWGRGKRFGKGEFLVFLSMFFLRDIKQKDLLILSPFL